jgi:hypothetical protein
VYTPFFKNQNSKIKNGGRVDVLRETISNDFYFGKAGRGDYL